MPLTIRSTWQPDPDIQSESPNPRLERQVKQSWHIFNMQLYLLRRRPRPCMDRDREMSYVTRPCLKYSLLHDGRTLRRKQRIRNDTQMKKRTSTRPLPHHRNATRRCSFLLTPVAQAVHRRPIATHHMLWYHRGKVARASPLACYCFFQSSQHAALQRGSQK
jgi:hypothetical protein